MIKNTPTCVQCDLIQILHEFKSFVDFFTKKYLHHTTIEFTVFDKNRFKTLMVFVCIVAMVSKEPNTHRGYYKYIIIIELATNCFYLSTAFHNVIIIRTTLKLSV